MCCAVLGAFSVFRSRFFCHCCRREAIVEILHHRNDKKELHSSRGALRQDQDLSVIQNTKQFLISIKR